MMGNFDEDYITREEFNRLKKELENEQLSHLQTKSKLLKTTEKLEVALAEIQQLNRELSQQKEGFKRNFGHLKDTAFEQKYHALMLKEKYNEIEKACGQQDDIILLKESKIKDLRTRLQEQKKTHEYQLTDQEIHIQQERYLAQNYYGTKPSNNKERSTNTTCKKK